MNWSQIESSEEISGIATNTQIVSVKRLEDQRPQSSHQKKEKKEKRNQKKNISDAYEPINDFNTELRKISIPQMTPVASVDINCGMLPDRKDPITIHGDNHLNLFTQTQVNETDITLANMINGKSVNKKIVAGDINSRYLKSVDRDQSQDSNGIIYEPMLDQITEDEKCQNDNVLSSSSKNSTCLVQINNPENKKENNEKITYGRNSKDNSINNGSFIQIDNTCIFINSNNNSNKLTGITTPGKKNITYDASIEFDKKTAIHSIASPSNKENSMHFINDSLLTTPNVSSINNKAPLSNVDSVRNSIAFNQQTQMNRKSGEQISMFNLHELEKQQISLDNPNSIYLNAMNTTKKIQFVPDNPLLPIVLNDNDPKSEIEGKIGNSDYDNDICCGTYTNNIVSSGSSYVTSNNVNSIISKKKIKHHKNSHTHNNNNNLEFINDSISSLETITNSKEKLIEKIDYIKKFSIKTFSITIANLVISVLYGISIILYIFSRSSSYNQMNNELLLLCFILLTILISSLYLTQTILEIKKLISTTDIKFLFEKAILRDISPLEESNTNINEEECLNEPIEINTTFEIKATRSDLVFKQNLGIMRANNTYNYKCNRISFSLELTSSITQIILILFGLIIGISINVDVSILLSLCFTIPIIILGVILTILKKILMERLERFKQAFEESYMFLNDYC